MSISWGETLSAMRKVLLNSFAGSGLGLVVSRWMMENLKRGGLLLAAAGRVAVAALVLAQADGTTARAQLPAGVRWPSSRTVGFC
jgi:hypothetical protein